MAIGNIVKNQKAQFFALGVLAATAGVKFIKSECFRKGCVKAVAGGMKLRNDAVASLAKIKEDAEDICAEAAEETTAE